MTESRGHEPDTPQEGLDQGLTSDERVSDQDPATAGGYDAPAEVEKQDEDESAPAPGADSD